MWILNCILRTSIHLPKKTKQNKQTKKNLVYAKYSLSFSLFGCPSVSMKVVYGGTEGCLFFHPSRDFLLLLPFKLSHNSNKHQQSSSTEVAFSSFSLMSLHLCQLSSGGISKHLHSVVLPTTFPCLHFNISLVLFLALFSLQTCVVFSFVFSADFVCVM